MDSFEFNKIAGAVLGTLLFVMGLDLLSEAIFWRSPPKLPGYDLPAAEEKPAGEAQAAVAPAAAEPLPKLLASADPTRGAADTKPCTTCHNFEKGGAAKVGPPLYGVVDRPVGEVTGFSYSEPLKAKGGKWTFEDLNNFIAAPGKAVPGTKMTYAGEKDPAKRADILAYLRTLSDAPVPLPK
jgi:cytochrome c